MKTPITEEMNVHKEWYEEARKQSVDTLEDFIKHLMGDYGHDYGTYCHAIAASMMATLYSINHSEEYGGITGFQASCIMWEIVRRMCFSDNKTGLRLINYDNMLYPQYEYKFKEKTITKGTFEALQKEAKEKLEEDDGFAHPAVVAHWQSIVDGEVPFGYQVKED